MNTNILTQEELKRHLVYDEKTGLFTRIYSEKKSKWLNRVAGTITKRGYVEISILSKGYRAHRLAWLYFYGNDIPEFIDHINGIKTDNRIVNLRAATLSQNNSNSKLSSSNTSGHKGISWDSDRSKWFVQCSVKGISNKLGRYSSKEEAINVYVNFAKEHHGEFYRD